MSSKDDLSEYLPSKLGLSELTKQANTGDQAALARLRETLEQNPQIWRAVGNLALHARMTLVNAIANGDELVKDSLLRYAYDMETELAGPSPSPLESLAVQRIVACWLEMQYVALQSPQATGDTLKQAKFVLQTKESAEKRFNAAIKSLSLIRKMLPAGAPVDTDHSDKPGPGTNGAAKAKANGSPITISPLETVPPASNGKNGHIPANRISQHFAPKPNGHATRLRVFPEDVAADEKHETQLT